MKVYRKAKNKEGEKGALVLEAAIVIPIFILVILFIYGLFIVTSAQNEISHALIQTAKSMSMDPYLAEHMDSVLSGDAEDFWGGIGDLILDFVRVNNDRYFSSVDKWYDSEDSSSVAKRRFVGFFANGDMSKANKRLYALGIKDGVTNGLNIESEIKDGDLTLVCKYTVQIWFDAFDLGKIPMEQSVTVKLFK